MRTVVCSSGFSPAASNTRVATLSPAARSTDGEIAPRSVHRGTLPPSPNITTLQACVTCMGGCTLLPLTVQNGVRSNAARVSFWFGFQSALVM